MASKLKAGKRRLGESRCERCKAPLYFPPWPAIIVKKEKPNGLACRTCVPPGEIVGTTAVAYFTESLWPEQQQVRAQRRLRRKISALS